MQTKSEPPGKSPTAAIRNVQFSVSKGAARRPDAGIVVYAGFLPFAENPMAECRDGLLGGGRE